MSKLKVADFYYGAVLSLLFNNQMKPALIEGDDNRQVYDLTSNVGEVRLFIKYRSVANNGKKLDYNSWTFTISDSERLELQKYLDGGFNLAFALVCGIDGLLDSELALLRKDEIRQIIELNRTSLTVSRKKHERAFRLHVDGGRDRALQIKANRFDDLFVS